MTRTTFVAHRVTVVLMTVAVLVATGDGFAQSYAGLYHWALEHGLHGWKAESFPLLVDLFIAVGELGLFQLALEGHRLRRSMAWADLALPFAIATGGWAVSLVFNVGAVGHQLADQVTAAVPPVASMLGLLVLLRTLHRLVSRQWTTPATPAAEPAPAAPRSGDGDEDAPADLRPRVAEPPIEVAGTDEELVAAAWAMGVSQRKIAKGTGINRHQVAAIIKGLAEVAEERPDVEPARINGHPVAAS